MNQRRQFEMRRRFARHLRAQGMSLSHLALILNVSWQTVRRYTR